MAEHGTDDETLIVLTCDIVAAHVSHNRIPVDEVAVLIEAVHNALAGLNVDPHAEPRPVPAVAIRASIRNDHMVCLEDGRKVKILKRHLRAEHGLTPAEYRARWDLPADYPMVPPDYSEERRKVARQIGLGQTPHDRRGGRRKTRK